MASLAEVAENDATTRNSTVALPRCCLLELPAELRMYIYELLLTSVSFDATPEEITRCTTSLETSNYIFNDAKPFFRCYEEKLFGMIAESRSCNKWLSVQRNEGPEVRRMLEEVAAYAAGARRLTRMATAVKVEGACSYFQGLRDFSVQETRKNMERQDRLRRTIQLKRAQR